jgi:hypothetical protein
MKKPAAITCVFVDVGGVLLTNGWDHHARKRAAANFKLEWSEMEDRHHPTFRRLRRGKTHAARIFSSGGFLPKATVHPGSVSALHVRAIETLPRHRLFGRTRVGGLTAGKPLGLKTDLELRVCKLTGADASPNQDSKCGMDQSDSQQWGSAVRPWVPVRAPRNGEFTT